MNILIPMSGRGRRMEGICPLPKPMIPLGNKSLIEWAVDTLSIDGKYIFVVLKEHGDNHGLGTFLLSKYNGSSVVYTDVITEGPACTCLLAKELIDNDEELVITNCDQVLKWDSSKFLDFVAGPMDGCVVTYYSQVKKNSYVKVDENGFAVELAEKRVISENSLNGIHYWKKGSDFVMSAEEMINNNDRSNNEFYIAPSYNYLIKKGKKITMFKLNEGEHHAVGTLEDFEKFLGNNNDN